MAGSTSRQRVTRVRPDEVVGGRASLAVEEPLEMHIDGQVLATTMRTPGHDFDLCLGYAITDAGISPDQVESIRYCGEDAGEVVPPVTADLSGPYRGEFNVLNLQTRARTGPLVPRRRAGPVSSACGVCGADVVADLVDRAGSVADDAVEVSAATVADVPERALEAQKGFRRTGGMHAAGAFAADGTLLVLREDVGRHNALDKLIGSLARAGVDPAAGFVVVTSRCSMEMVQKTATFGCPVLVAVSAPTALAVELAERAGLTVCAFARGEGCNVYSRPAGVG